MFPAIIAAEKNWRVLSVARDGSPRFVEIIKWGVPLTLNGKLTPLDALETDLSARDNFVKIIPPGEEMPEYLAAQLCARMVRERNHKP